MLETFTKFAVTRLPKLALPEIKLPITDKLVKLPTLVILGWALVYIVLATSALATWPVTLAPVIDDNPEPFPVILVTANVLVL